MVGHIRAWLPLLARDVPEFDASTFGDKPDVPDDVLEDGGRLIELLGEVTNASGEALPYANAALAVLGPALAAANTEWAQAEAADSTHQKLAQDVRATASACDTELQAFRRSLGHIAGRNDKDYQKLRVERASHADDDDDASGPAAPAPVTPAAPGSDPPTT